ncbi:MAG: hypothetical protein ABSE73_26400 [Planctomycetota bacterium]
MKEKVVLIGAGSAMFTKGLIADLLGRKWEADLALVDTDPGALEVAEKLAAKMVAARRAPVSIFASVERRAVLKGATAVICTVGVGGRRAWEQDCIIPRKYGIFEPVGDTVMPGGTARALRMIPPMVAIARDVLDLAPQALFFNYGNPMTPVCRAIRRATGAPVVGLCHGVHHVGQYLADVLGAPRAAVNYTAVGVNHLTWFTAFRVHGEDAMPRLRRIAREGLSARQGSASGSLTEKEQKAVKDNPFSWGMLDLFGAFPAVLDRHVVEFFPALFRGRNSYYGKTLGVECFNIEEVIARGDRIYAGMRAAALSPQPLGEDFFAQFSGEHEQVLEIIESVRRDAGRLYSANLPNQGQVPNLPPEAVLEAPALADGAGLRALAQKPLSPGLAGTLATRLAWTETVVEAALEGSREKFIQALLLDGAVDCLETAAQLADELLAAHKQYLPQFAS